MDALQDFMLLRNGNVVAEGWWTPYGPQSPHPLQSLRKSFTSTAIGLAVQEGLLTVDDPVLMFFPDDAPANPSENLKAMRVRHLLSMNAGYNKDTTERVYQHLFHWRPRIGEIGITGTAAAIANALTMSPTWHRFTESNSDRRIHARDSVSGSPPNRLHR